MVLIIKGLFEIIDNEQHRFCAVFAFLGKGASEEFRQRRQKLRLVRLHCGHVMVNNFRNGWYGDAFADGAQDVRRIVTAEDNDCFVAVFEAVRHTRGKARFALTSDAVDENAGVTRACRGAKGAEDFLDIPAASDEFLFACDGNLFSLGVEKCLHGLAVAEATMVAIRCSKGAAAA